MKFPNFENKSSLEAMVEPKNFLNYIKELGSYPSFQVPKGIIFCYQRKLLNYIVTNHEATKVNGFGGDMYLLNEGKIAVIGNFGIGAPAVITILEELIAFGVKKFISIGTAGTLQKNIEIGSLMVCDKAIRDEGTSHHYLKPSKYAYASKNITSKLINSLEKKQQDYFVGSSWTIDAPYRETIEEARQYQAEGVSTVEMEASALFAVAEYRNVELGAMFTISDSLAELEWKPQMASNKTKTGLEILYRVAVDVLS